MFSGAPNSKVSEKIKYRIQPLGISQCGKLIGQLGVLRLWILESPARSSLLKDRIWWRQRASPLIILLFILRCNSCWVTAIHDRRPPSIIICPIFSPEPSYFVECAITPSCLLLTRNSAELMRSMLCVHVEQVELTRKVTQVSSQMLPRAAINKRKSKMTLWSQASIDVQLQLVEFG